MINVLSDNKIKIKIENEIEKMILPLILEIGDIIETRIVRNVFSKKNGKKIDRIETLAKIIVRKINLEKMRIIGKIESASSEKIDKGFHGENIEIGKEFQIEKRKNISSIEEFLKKINKFKIIENKNLKKIIEENQKRIIFNSKNIEEHLEYGLLEKIIICKKYFYTFLKEIKRALEKNTEILLFDEIEFCEKIKILGILRFEI